MTSLEILEDKLSKTKNIIREEEWSNYFTYINTTKSPSTNIFAIKTPGKRILWLSEYTPPEKASARESVNEYVGNNLDLVIEGDNFIFVCPINIDKVRKENHTYHGSKEDNFTILTYQDSIWQEFEKLYKPTLEKITSFSELKENWDSYSGKPIKKETIQKGREILFHLYRSLANENQRLPGPFVAPCPDGRIQFEWDKQNKEIELVILSRLEDSMSMIWSEGGEIYENENVSLSNVVKRLLWLVKNNY